MNLVLTNYNNINADIVYSWKISEENHEYYTCRPVKKIGNIDEYNISITNWLSIPGNVFLLLMNKDTLEPIGEIKGFDLNIRNHSMEFGFYLPKDNRKLGYGSIMVKMFLKYIFEDALKDINKLYATTADNNDASKKLLIKNGFILDGRNREHYWIQNQRYDQLVSSILKKEWEEREKNLTTAST
jgi:[ribosomal protein S5]-alanine N-acetyltransferase